MNTFTRQMTCRAASRNPLRRAVIEALESRRMLSVNVTSWHNDAGLTGLNPNEQILTPADVNVSSFGELFSYPVTGQVYAQPLYVSNLAIPGQGTHNVLFVATQDNDVYAFDADSNSGVAGGLLWHVNLGPAAATPNSNFGNRYGDYHDINPQVGITSTPVIDLSTNTMYVDSFTNDVPGQDVYSNHIHALDITTGQDKVVPVLVAAAVHGNSLGGDGSTITFSAEHQLQRPALALVNGTLYAAFGGFADTDPYHGWILGFNPATLSLNSVFNDSPNLLSTPADDTAGEGGIWQGGAGLASNGSDLFFMIGNGDFSSSLNDWGDSIVKLSTDSTTASSPGPDGYGTHVADYFTPYDQQQLSDADEDLGSGGGILIPAQPGSHPDEYIGAGKQGTIYLIDATNMGQYNATTNADLQEANLGHGMFGSPAYFNNAVYFHAVGDVLKKFTLTNGALSAAPSAQASIAYSSQGATPSISSNGTANGIVWDVQWDASHQVLHAYDASTLKELYDSYKDPTRDQMGAGVKFITPTIADGEVFVGSSGAVTVYGLLSPPTTAPAAPSALTAVAASGSSVTLHWVDNSNNEAGFDVERSLDGSIFSQIAVTSANATTFTDALDTPNTQYFYRICATNVIGNSAYTAVASVKTPLQTDAADLFHFNEGVGTTTTDSAGGNTGTLVGATLPQWVTPGEQGAAALSFSGDGQYNQNNESAVQAAGDLSPVLGSTSTLDVWVKTTQIGSSTHWMAPAITGVEQAAGNNDINWGTLDASGRIGIYVGDSGGIFSINPINDNQWHNVAITRDATTGIVQLFIDGILNSAATLDTGNKTSSFSLIGALTDVASDGVTRTGANYFNGQLDELRIYNRALGMNEIESLSVIPAPPVLTSATVNPGPVVHLVFSNASSFAGNIEIDRMTGANGVYTPLATLPVSATSYDDVDVNVGTTYYYVARAIDSAGSSIFSNAQTATPPVPTVVGNYLFYNNSKFDGGNGSSNLTDDNAIATDKTALLPGQTAGFANISSYSRGINGIMIDVNNLVYLPRIDDFSFMVGNSPDTTLWTAAPSPTYVNTYPGRGPGGSTQITVIWADNAIQNQWLQVTLLAQPHLDLPANDVFYFGSAIGDTGSTTANALVTAADAARVAANFNSSAGVTNPFDINRDGVVDASDVTAVNHNLTTASAGLNLISISTAAEAAPSALTASAAVNSVTLSWNASPGAMSYNIYRGSTSGGESGLPLMSNILGTTFVDTTAVAPKTYYYTVTAVNPNLAPQPVESAPSSEVSTTVTLAKLGGTPIGTSTSWLNHGDTIAQVFDGNLNTYFDAPDSNLSDWVGLDLGSPQTISQIRYAPRTGYEWRMIGGQFQASNSATFTSGVVTLGTVTAAPVAGQLTTMAVAPGAAYRFIRYIGGNQWVNIAEMELDGAFTAPAGPVPSALVNADFETPSLSSGMYQYDAPLPGWTMTGTAALVTAASPWSPPLASGNQSVALQGFNANPVGAISQTFNAAGGTYVVSFLAAQRGYATGTNTVQPIAVMIDGNPVGTISPSTYSFLPYSTSPFSLSAGAHTLTLSATINSSGDSASFVDAVSITLSTTPVVSQLSGAVIGTSASWANSGDTIAQVFDGNFNTYFDAPNSSLTNWVGLDLGVAEVITQIKYAPRAGYEFRMIGGQFQVSSTPDFSANVVTMATISSAPAAGQFTVIGVSPGAAYRYVRYVGGTQWVNIAEMEVDGIAAAHPVTTKLSGSVIGTPTSWANSGDTIAQVFDGSFNTFFDAANSSLTNWVGLDLGYPQTITQIKYAPRAGYEFRMIGGQFQVSSTPDFSSNVVTLATIAAAPAAGQFTAIAVSPGAAYRYVRYVGGTQWVNIAEMEVDGLASSAPVAAKITGAVIGTATSWANKGDTIAQVFDGDFSTYFDAPNSSLTNWVGLDLGSNYAVTTIKYAPRAGYEYRMVGGQFQMSTTADFSSNVITVATITTAPAAGAFTTISIAPTPGFRYIRYVGGTQWVNIAEMEIDGYAS